MSIALGFALIISNQLVIWGLGCRSWLLVFWRQGSLVQGLLVCFSGACRASEERDGDSHGEGDSGDGGDGGDVGNGGDGGSGGDRWW